MLKFLLEFVWFDPHKKGRPTLPVPEGPLDVVVLCLWRFDGVWESEEGERQVDETVLVQVDIRVTLKKLVQLQTWNSIKHNEIMVGLKSMYSNLTT